MASRNEQKGRHSVKDNVFMLKQAIVELKKIAIQDDSFEDERPWHYTGGCNNCGGVKAFFDWIEKKFDELLTLKQPGEELEKTAMGLRQNEQTVMHQLTIDRFDIYNMLEGIGCPAGGIEGITENVGLFPRVCHAWNKKVLDQLTVPQLLMMYQKLKAGKKLESEIIIATPVLKLVKGV